MIRFRVFCCSVTAAFLLFHASPFLQTSALKLEEIMAGNAYIGHQPYNFNWDAASANVYFRWNKDNDLVAPYYTYNLVSKKLTKVNPDPNTPQAINGFWQDKATDPSYFKAGKSIYKKTNKTYEKIYTTSLNYTIHSAIGHQLILKQDQNLFILNTEKGSYNQLTHFKQGNAPENAQTPTYLEKEEEALFETLRINKAKTRAEIDFNKNLESAFLSPHYLGDWTWQDLVIARNLEQLVFIQRKQSSSQQTAYMNYITDNGYAQTEMARANVGTKDPTNALYIWHLAQDSLIEVNFDALTGINTLPEFYAYYPEKVVESYKKELVYHLHGFNETGDKCLVEIKSYDNKDRWIGYVEVSSATFVQLDHQHDTAWIGGPGISSWKDAKGTVGWIDDVNFYYQSEESGYSHLYQCNTNTKTKKALTSGNFEVHEVQLSKDGSTFFISANKTHPGNRNFYALDLKTGQLTPILTQDGRHDVLISPDEKWLLVNYSHKNKPWNLYLAPNKPYAEMEPITQCETEAFNAYPWRQPPVISFKARDGQPVNARLYEPTTETKNGAAILFVHGAGYLQNAHNWWSVYYREYMFHNLLCDLGFTVLDVDYRASEGYGRDFRTAIYRNMGGTDLADFVDARKFLIDEYGIDSNRVGIYGGSYGGFITLMALLKEPGKFACGAAIRSVTDWAHYNHAYTSNILNTPETDPLAYKQSSPIYYAHNLTDRLLMLHGMVDDNVHYQDVVRLSQRFIELGKTKWDLIGYPVEPHGFVETTSWVDEYGRILKLFEEELLNK